MIFSNIRNLLTESSHKFSSTQFNLPKNLSLQILKLAKVIKDSDLADDGREKLPHVTVKYGIHTNNFKQIEKIVKNQKTAKIKLGNISLFKAPDYDVVKIDVISKDLEKLNKLISTNIKCTDTHPVYHPHITIAYVKSGIGSKYIKNNHSLKNKEFTLTDFVFSNKERKMTHIVLKEEQILPSLFKEEILHHLLESSKHDSYSYTLNDGNDFELNKKISTKIIKMHDNLSEENQNKLVLMLLDNIDSANAIAYFCSNY